LSQLPESRVPEARPLLSVVRGEPTAAELAALVVVLAARAGQGQPAGPAQPRLGEWSSKRRLLRLPPVPGRDAWRVSVLPG
jgi:Acyl-CoA carboxylase epsilon subunit